MELQFGWNRIDKDTHWRYSPGEEFKFTYRCNASVGFFYLKYRSVEDIITDLFLANIFTTSIKQILSSACDLLMIFGKKRVITFEPFREKRILKLHFEN